MRQNPSFTLADVVEMRRVIEQNPWATIVSSADEGQVASHYVMMLDDERDDLTIVGHVGRPDDLIHGMGERELLVVFQGPQRIRVARLVRPRHPGRADVELHRRAPCRGARDPER